MFKVFLAKVVAAKFASLVAALVAALATLVASMGGASPGSGALPTPTVAVTASPAPTATPVPPLPTVEPSPVVTPAPTPLPVVSTPIPKPVAKPSLAGLCNAVAHKSNLSALDKSTAFSVLINAAGGKDKVASYCASTFGIAVVTVVSPKVVSDNDADDIGKTPCPNHDGTTTPSGTRFGDRGGFDSSDGGHHRR